jgi:hypothetical protein
MIGAASSGMARFLLAEVHGGSAFERPTPNARSSAIGDLPSLLP